MSRVQEKLREYNISRMDAVAKSAVYFVRGVMDGRSQEDQEMVYHHLANTGVDINIALRDGVMSIDVDSRLADIVYNLIIAFASETYNLSRYGSPARYSRVLIDYVAQEFAMLERELAMEVQHG